MQAALILMTILGCDDSVSQCHYVDTVSGQWSSIEECDRNSEPQLDRFTDRPFPVIVAVCETATASDGHNSGESNETEMAGATSGEGYPIPAVGLTAGNRVALDDTATPGDKKSLSERVKATIARVLPTLTDIKAIAGKPVHFAADTYTWVVKRLDF